MTARFWLSLWLALAFSFPAFAQNLLQKIPPKVQRGIKAYGAERFEDALVAFDEAQREIPSNAQLEFNRGTTFYKQEKYEEALQSLSHARELDDGKLQGDIFYNMGNTYAAMGHAADAIASYRQALRINPQDAMARHNLEFLLGQPPAPQKDNSKNNQKTKNTSGDNNPSDDSNPESNPNTPPQPKPRDNKIPPPDNETTPPKNTHGNQENSSQTSQNTQPDSHSKSEHSNEETLEKNAQEDGFLRQQKRQLGQEDADKILDAFGMDEKSYEPWRFQKKTPVEGWQYEQDW
ncbi:MAG: tetratricopeptide repeat protein [Cystobacterineae bacterium]|nr:tetratricopeptide repeat protein [Cystobacterineae bacterium]